jgi:hypothetical protein
MSTRPPARRQARLELDAALRRPLPRAEADALVSLLIGRGPALPHPHPLFGQPEAAGLLTGESLDHATTGSCVVQDADGGARLLVSSSLPPLPGLLEAGLDWLGGLLAAEAGAILGYVVPAAAHRHDLRLLVWDGQRPVPLPGCSLPEAGIEIGAEGCSLVAFTRAAGLPDPASTEREALAGAMRRVALAQLAGQSLPVSQSGLDGPLWQGAAALFRRWLAAAAAQYHGFTTAVPPLSLHLA